MRNPRTMSGTRAPNQREIAGALFEWRADQGSLSSLLAKNGKKGEDAQLTRLT